MPEIFDTNFGTSPVTANGQLINFPSTSGTLSLVSDVAAVSGTIDLVFSKSGQPQGFENFTDSILFWNDATRTFTISGNYYVWVAGHRYNKTFETQTIPNVTGNHFFYYNSNNVFTYSTSAWNIVTDVPICYVTWFGSKGVAYEERHGITMDSVTHNYLHKTRGTQYVSGISLNNYTLDSTVLSDVQFSTDPGVIADEDISFNVPNISGGAYTILSKSGPAGDWIMVTDNVLPMLDVGGDVAFNEYVSGQWVMTPLTVNNVYVNYYVVATTAISSKYDIFLIPGQAYYTTIPDAQSEVFTALDLSKFPIQETVLLHRVMYERKNTYPTLTARSVIKQTAKITQNTTIQTIGGNSVQHNNLLGLQGGSLAEYYHLTNAEYTDFIGASEISGAYVPNNGNTSISGTKTFVDPVIVSNTLTSNKYILGTDLSLLPVVGNQSVISTWWGMQLRGNQQSNVDFTPTAIGGAGDYGIIIPTQTPTISSAVMQRAFAGQTCDFYNWQDSSGNVLSEIRSNGNFNGHIDYVPAASGNWFTPPTLIDSAIDDLASNWFSNQRIILKDDFMYFAVPTATPQGPAGFAADVAGTAAALTMVASTAGHYGVIQFGTGSTATGRAGLSLGVSTIMPTGTFIYETYIMFPTLSVAAQEYTGIVGMSDTQTALPNNGVYFIYDRLTAGSNVLRIATAAGGTRTITNTATTLVAGTWYKLKIVATLSGTKRANYYINGVLAGSISTNIPTLVSGIRAQILKIAGTTASTMQVDYINIAMDIPAR